MAYTHYEIYLAIKELKHGFFFLEQQMRLEAIMLNEINQSEKNKSHIFPDLWKLKI